MKFKKINKGFTLVELIVVIAIIGILAAVLIPSITGYLEKASFSNDQQDAGNMTKLVQTYTAEHRLDLKKITPNEIKTIILSSGQYDLKARNKKWTFVWNKLDDKVEAMYFNESIVDTSYQHIVINHNNKSKNLDTSSSISHPEEVLKSGYYLIGKGNSTIEEVVNLIRNYDGSEDYSTILNKLDNTAFSKYKETLNTMFNPSTTLFINEKGSYSSADTYFRESDSGSPDEYELLTSQNYASDLIFYIKDGMSWTPLEGNIALYTIDGEDYNPYVSDTPYENVVTLYYELNESHYVKVYIGKKYPTLQRVIFGDSISYIPGFTDKVRLPSTISVPSTVEFVSEGAFFGVVSNTMLSFSGKVVFESGFRYNDNMVDINGGQPITSSIDYESKGITLFNVLLVQNKSFENINILDGYTQEQLATIKEGSTVYRNGDFVQLVKGQNIMLDLSEVRNIIPDGNTIDGLEIRMGVMDRPIEHNGFRYSDKFVAKLYSNGKIVGYCCVYYRNVTSISHG